MPQYLMGIDLGTSSVKVLLIDSSGIILGVRANSYEIQSRHPGWAEQDMDLLWEATASTIKELLTGTGIDPIQIKGIVGTDAWSGSAEPRETVNQAGDYLD